MSTHTATPWPLLGRLARLHADFLRPHHRAILLALAAMLAGSLLLLPAPLVQGWALDQLIAPGTPREKSTAVLLALVFSLACHLLRMVLVWRGSAVMNRVSLEVVQTLTDALHRKLQRLPLAYFDRHPTGGLMARITSDVGSLLLFLSGGSLQLASDLVLALGVAGVLLWLRWELALVCFVVVPLYAAAQHLFARRIDALAGRVRGEVGALYGLLSERISAVRVVRSFAQEDAELRALDERLESHRSLGSASLRTAAQQSALALFLGGLGTVAVLCAGVLLIQAGRLSVGELLALSALSAQLYNPLVRLMQFQSGAAATRVALDRMLEVLDEPESADRPDAQPVRAPRGRLVFENVSFRYRPDGPAVLENVQFTVEPGWTVGVLGESGSGKSTLLALAPRLYDVDAGRVLLDGRDVRTLRRAELRRAVVLAPQQAVLFEGTLESNLRYAAPDAPVAELRRVLAAVDLANLVDALPLGLRTPVGDRGLTLSGGQRQRLALARALLARPVVLLLDDATSALDAETEARVGEALAGMLPGCTRIIVSHKPASLARADWVVVLQAGRIVRQGRPDEVFTAA